MLQRIPKITQKNIKDGLKVFENILGSVDVPQKLELPDDPETTSATTTTKETETTTTKETETTTEKEMTTAISYGLDFDEKYRNLPDIGVLHPKIYEKTEPETIVKS